LATISDVAERAGVSRATVSRYLNGHPVRARANVESAIAELAYTPSGIARSLKSGLTRVIGVVVPDITNPFFAAVVKGIEENSRDAAYNIFLCNTEESALRQTQVLAGLMGLIDALILAPATESTEVPAAVGALGVPVVLLDREFADHNLFDSVLVDNEGGAAQAARYLAQLGHRRIGLISGPLTATPGRTRYEGFLQGLEDSGLTVPGEYIRIGDFREISGYISAKSLLSVPEPPSALFVANNLMAIGALTAIKEAKLRLPRDLSFVSFDDLDVGHLLEPPITTISRPMAEQGALAMTLLRERLQGQPIEGSRRCILETKLTVRGSCAEPQL
jgi:LacI family transcriptional regulator